MTHWSSWRMPRVRTRAKRSGDEATESREEEAVKEQNVDCRTLFQVLRWFLI